MDIVLAAGVIDDAKGLGEDIRALLGGVVLTIMFLAMVIVVGFSTRSILKTTVAAIGGGILLGIVASQATISDKTEEELEQDHGAPAPVVRVVGDRAADASFIAGATVQVQPPYSAGGLS